MPSNGLIPLRKFKFSFKVLTVFKAIVCAFIVAIFQSGVWALYIGLGLLTVTFNAYFIAGKLNVYTTIVIMFVSNHSRSWNRLVLQHNAISLI